MIFRSTLDNFQRKSHLFPNVDDSFRSFRVFEFEMRSLEISCRSSSQKTVSRSQVQPFVLAIRRPEIHNPIWDYMRTIAILFFRCRVLFFEVFLGASLL